MASSRIFCLGNVSWEGKRRGKGKDRLFRSLSYGFLTHHTSAPRPPDAVTLLGVSLLDSLDKLGKLALVSILDLSQGEDCCSLLVDDSSETSLAFDDGVRHTHLATESGKEDNQLDGVNIIGDEDEAGLLVLNEPDDVVETVLDHVWLLADLLLLLAISDSRSLLGQTLLLVGAAFRAVLLEELEGLCGGVAVKGVGELVERRGNLETHVEDLALALKANILRPLDHAGEVTAGLDVGTDTKVARAAFDERVLRAS